MRTYRSRAIFARFDAILPIAQVSTCLRARLPVLPPFAPVPLIRKIAFPLTSYPIAHALHVLATFRRTPLTDLLMPSSKAFRFLLKPSRSLQCTPERRQTKLSKRRTQGTGLLSEISIFYHTSIRAQRIFPEGDKQRPKSLFFRRFFHRPSTKRRDPKIRPPSKSPKEKRTAHFKPFPSHPSATKWHKARRSPDRHCLRARFLRSCCLEHNERRLIAPIRPLYPDKRTFYHTLPSVSFLIYPLIRTVFFHTP